MRTFGDQCHAPVRNVMALGPGRQWEWGGAIGGPGCSCRHCHGRWWVVTQSPCELHVACFCAMLGPPLIDGGDGGGTRCPPIAVVVVALRHRSCQWVMARLLHAISV